MGSLSSELFNYAFIYPIFELPEAERIFTDQLKYETVGAPPPSRAPGWSSTPRGVRRSTAVTNFLHV
eukprot:3174273-Prymnesium_polylepis.2